MYGHNAFAHPLKFDELLIKVSFLRFVQRWVNASAIMCYENLNFIEEWTQYLCAVNH